MNYKAVHDYLKDTVAGLNYTTTFFHGRTVNAQQVREKDSFFVWLEPIVSTASFTANQAMDKSYNVTMFVAMQDRPDTAINRNSQAESTSKEIDILEQTSYVTYDFLRKINDNDISASLQDSSDLLVISSINVTPLIKASSAMLTGMAITFTMQVPDEFDYCCD